MEEQPLTPDQQEALDLLVKEANDKLEDAGQSRATQAFNLGCSMTLIPGLVVVVLAFILSRANWVMALIIAAVVILLALGLANLAAYTAKTNAIQRIYQLEAGPEIERALKKIELSRAVFDARARHILPQDAALQGFIQVSNPVESEMNTE